MHSSRCCSCYCLHKGQLPFSYCLWWRSIALLVHCLLKVWWCSGRPIKPQSQPSPCTQEPSPLKCLSAETGICTQTQGKMWEILPRKPRIAQFGDIFPFNAFLKRLNLLTRKQASTILQIWCWHFPLNAYLHKINKVDSSRCPACDKDQEGLSPPETINHFVFNCMAHLVAR